MLNLDAIKFEVDTSELTAAVQKLDALRSSLSKVTTPTKALAKAERDLAAANLANSKAADVQARTAERTAKAQRVIESSTKAATSILQRQKDILEFMAAGFSKGQSSTLAYAKASGQLSKELEGVLVAQRKLQGGDPFDKSQAGVTSLKNQLAELKDEMRATGAGVELTSKQYKELARDKMRLIEAAKQTGSSFAELRQKIRDYQAEFITTAQKVNMLTEAEKTRERAARDRANATRAVAAEEERMAAITANLNDATLQHSSASDVAARRLANYQRNLRLAGVEQSLATKKLAAYKVQLEAAMAVENKRRMDHLSRALAPQISDVVVSLGSGMNPMTVLLQQGLQVRDLIGQSGVAAQDLQKAFKTAASEMVSSIRGTIVALGALAFGALADAGKAVTSFAGSLPGISHGLDGINRSIDSMTKSGVPGMSMLAKAVQYLGTTFVALSSLGILGVITMLGGLLIATGKVISEQTDLSRALLTTGASLGLTAASARDLAGSIDGLSTSKGIEVLTEMGKAGGFTKEQFNQIAIAAADMERYVGQSIEDTIKQFKDLQKDPVEALAKLAAGNGQVELATLKRIKQLKDAGKEEQAVAEATLAHAAALQAISATAEAELHPMQRLWIDIKKAIGSVWEEIKNLARADAIILPFRVAFDTVKGVVYDTWLGIKFIGRAIAGVIAVVSALATGGITAAAATVKTLKDDFKDGVAEREKFMKGLYNYDKPDPNTGGSGKAKNAKDAAAFLETLKKTKTEAEKADDKLQTFVNSMAAAKEQAEYFDDSLTDADKALIKIQNSEAWKNGSPGMKKQAIDAAEAASAAQRYLAGINAIKAALERLADVQLDAKLLDAEGAMISSGMDSNLVAYYSSMKKEELDLENRILGIRNSQANETQKALQIDIERQITAQKILNIQTEYKNKIEETVQALTKSTAEETALLEFQASTIGLIGKERDRQLKIKQLELEMERELAKVLDENQKTRIRDAYAQKIKNVDKEIALDYSEKMYDSVTDALVTALVDGGKEGSKKLRDIIEAELREPITIFVKAIVQQMVGGIFGGGSGSGGSWMEQAASGVYNYYTQGAGANSIVGTGVNAISNYAVASSYGTTAGSQQTAMLLAQEQGMTTAAGGWMSYVNYAALIAAAVMVAENLYEKGWNRKALGDGDSEQKRFGYTKFNTDPNMGNSAIYDYADPGMSKFRRNMMDMVGFSEKWADIFSGSVRMANLFGRKLGAYGYAAEIQNGETTSVGGFARYKGGLFRSNKTVAVDIDSRDAEKLRADIETIKESSRNMAVSMGYSAEAIDNYSGSLKVNFKNATTAEEQAKRYAEAMENLQWEMLKSTDGFKMTREEFKQLREEALKLGEASGYSAQTMTDTLIAGMTGRMDQANVGAVIGDQIVGSIYNALASGFAQSITNSITTMIIQPIMTSILMGGSVSAAVSSASINAVMTQARAAINYFNQLVSDPAFQAFIADMNKLGADLARLTVTPAKHIKAFGTAAMNAGNAAADAAKKIKDERYNIEGKLLGMLGRTAELRQRELAALHASNRALQQHIYALEDAEAKFDAVVKAAEETLDKAKEARDSVKEVFDYLTDQIRELRNEVEGPAAMQRVEAQRYLNQLLASGETPDQEKLSRAVESLRGGLENENFATQQDADRQRLLLANTLSGINKNAEGNLSKLDKEIKLLEDQLKLAEDQKNALNGIQTYTFNTVEAVKALQVTMDEYANVVGKALGVVVKPPSGPPTVKPTGTGSGSSGGGGRSGSSGGGSSGGSGSGKQWTADGYWSKNKDLQEEFARLLAADLADDMKANSPQFNKDPNLSYRDEYLKWHWETKGQNEKRKYAKGGAFTNSVVFSPTSFHNSEMAEKGPEAIMPLENVGGSLGVRAISSSTDQLEEKFDVLNIAVQQMAVTTNKLFRLFNNARGEDGTSINVTVTNESTNPVLVDPV